jgi:hypothetical protein
MSCGDPIEKIRNWEGAENCVAAAPTISIFYKVYKLSQHFIVITKSRMMRWAMLVACIGHPRSAYTVLVINSEGKKPL